MATREVEAARRARAPLERRARDIMRMPSILKSGRRASRLLKELCSIHEQLKRIKPWNVVPESLGKKPPSYEDLFDSNGRSRCVDADD